MDQNTKKGFKMPSSYTILMIVIALMAVMTWFIPAGSYEKTEAGAVVAGSYQVVDSNPQGFYDNMGWFIICNFSVDAVIVNNNTHFRLNSNINQHLVHK